MQTDLTIICTSSIDPNLNDANLSQKIQSSPTPTPNSQSFPDPNTNLNPEDHSHSQTQTTILYDHPITLCMRS